MQEVTIQLRFTRECLGFAKKPTDSGNGVIYKMPRDGAGRVMFLQSWWKAGLVYAARVVNRCHREVAAVTWSSAVEGKLAEWRRIVQPARGHKKARYALHEAFRPKTVVQISAVLPDGLSIPDFIELLDVVGKYRGISPFQAADDVYGTFDVVAVTPAIRHSKKQKQESKNDATRTDSPIGDDD